MKLITKILFFLFPVLIFANTLILPPAGTQRIGDLAAKEYAQYIYDGASLTGHSPLPVHSAAKYIQHKQIKRFTPHNLREISRKFDASQILVWEILPRYIIQGEIFFSHLRKSRKLPLIRHSNLKQAMDQLRRLVFSKQKIIFSGKKTEKTYKTLFFFDQTPRNEFVLSTFIKDQWYQPGDAFCFQKKENKNISYSQNPDSLRTFTGRTNWKEIFQCLNTYQVRYNRIIGIVDGLPKISIRPQILSQFRRLSRQNKLQLWWNRKGEPWSNFWNDTQSIFYKWEIGLSNGSQRIFLIRNNDFSDHLLGLTPDWQTLPSPFKFNMKKIKSVYHALTGNTILYISNPILKPPEKNRPSFKQNLILSSKILLKSDGFPIWLFLSSKNIQKIKLKKGEKTWFWLNWKKENNKRLIGDATFFLRADQPPSKLNRINLIKAFSSPKSILNKSIDQSSIYSLFAEVIEIRQ